MNIVNYDKNDSKTKTNSKGNDKVNILAIIIVLELVLGGSGRLITVGSFFTIRYILFFIAIFYFIIKVIRNNWRINKDNFYLDIFLFFCIFIFGIMNGLLHGYGTGNIIKSSQGYLYLLMYFPFSLLVDTKEKSNYIFDLFINSTVVLSVITFIIFIFFMLDPSIYRIISPILNKFDYGYMAIRGGLPAVFLKTSPYMSISFLLLLFQYINIQAKRSVLIILKLLFLLFGIMSTMSMGIWIATFMGVFLAIVISKGKYKVKLVAIVVILASIVITFFSEYITVSLYNRLSTTDSSFVIKFDQLFRLIENWTKGLILGNGFGIEITFLTDLGSRTMINFELFWLQLLVNLGLLGFVLYIKLFIRSSYYAFKLSKNLIKREAIHLKSLIVGLLILVVVSSVNPFLNNPIGIGYLIIVMSTVNAYLKDYKKELINYKYK